MAASSRSCMLHHAWRYVALASFVICLVTALVPLSFSANAAQGSAGTLSILVSGWFFLGLFWNSFVVGWETDRKELMHPGAVVALDLLTWLYGVVAVVWSCFVLVGLTRFYREANEYNDSQYDNDRHYYRYYYEISDHDYMSSMACFGVFVAFAVIATVIHFALFVAGCINEDRRLKTERVALAVRNAGNPAVVAQGTPGGQPGYLGGMNAAVADKQAEIEMMECSFGEPGDARV